MSASIDISSIPKSKASISLTNSLKAYLLRYRETNGKHFLGIRIGIISGGCYGMQYKVSLNSFFKPNDELILVEGIPIVFGSPLSVYLDGLTIDYYSDGLSERFRFVNPAISSDKHCPCGKSIKCP